MKLRKSKLKLKMKHTILAINASILSLMFKATSFDSLDVSFQETINNLRTEN